MVFEINEIFLLCEWMEKGFDFPELGKIFYVTMGAMVGRRPEIVILKFLFSF